LVPEDEEDVLHRREAAAVPVTTVLLGLAILRGGTTVVFLEHVALLEGVVDRSLVIWARLLQHVIEHVGASRGRSRALSGQVDCEGLVPVIVVPLRVRLTVRLLAPFVFLLGLFGFVTLRGLIVYSLDFLAIEDGPHRLLVGSFAQAGGDIEQLIGVNRRASPKLAHEVPAGGTLEEGVHDLRLSYARVLGTMLGEVLYEVPERLTRLLGTRPLKDGLGDQRGGGVNGSR
jgi:hypothetical protein